MFTSGCNIYRSSRVRALIPRNLQVPKDKSTDLGNMWLYATEVLRKEDRYRLSLQCESEIKKSCFQAGQQIQQISTYTSDLHQPNLRVLPSIDIPMSISGNSTLLQVQTRPMPKKYPEKETSERRHVHAKGKGPATDKPTLMPTEASNVSPSGLTPTRENYFRPREP
ncbi:hypothetical protein F2Q69_00021411 [Brassica cretica]|uniref:Uncharacterized protein n=1 Tax=Brassica cretica TaxID=69181 RepID=A0A8S9QLI8_BRACR|nr:hypothetical protein F2Q69_00021411 [Brassica cretica]